MLHCTSGAYGGGGAGLGGAIFVRQGATVLIVGGGFSGGTVTGGTATSPAVSGLGIGQSMFLAGSATYEVDSGSITLSDTIGGGTDAQITGGFTKTGAGTLTLSGVNTNTGNTTISGGTLALSGSGSINGTPTISIAAGATFDVSAVTPSGYALNSFGTLALNINKTGSTLTQGQMVLGTKNLTYGGALTVTASGNTLAAGDSFPLLTTSGTWSGWFSSVSVPALASGISWDTNKLATTGVMDIYYFTNVTLALTTPVNSNAVIGATKLLNHTGSSRGTASAAAVSTPGHGTASLSSGVLTYSPTANYSGSDSFTCTFQDGHGWQTITVNVTVGSGNGSSANSVYTGTANGNFVAQFAGIPGDTYTVETNSVVSGAGWTKLGNFAAPSNNSQGLGIGVFGVTNAMGAETTLYFRTVWPSY